MKKIYSIIVFALLSSYIFAGSDLTATYSRANLHHCSITRNDNDLAILNNTDSDYNDVIVPTLSIFPNPVKSSATISFTYAHIDKISILNIVGKEMKTYMPEPGEKDIKVNLIDLQPGVYFLSAYYKGQTLTTKKFMKDK